MMQKHQHRPASRSVPPLHKQSVACHPTNYNQVVDPRFLEQAVQLALNNVRQSLGGPFGAVVVKDGIVIAEAANSVTRTNDPTAHAEVLAIRQACSHLNSFQLTGAELYSSCEPCPMCLGAIYWARLDRVYFANTQQQAAAAGFDDSFIYREIALPTGTRSIPMTLHTYPEADAPFTLWKQTTARIDY